MQNFTNTLEDIAAMRAMELGFTADHYRPSIEREVSAAGELFEKVTTAAFEGRASLREAGVRVLVMARRCGLRTVARLPKREVDKAERSAGVALLAGHGSGLEAMRVFELLMGREQDPARIGRRVSLIAYALNPNMVVMKSLPNLGGIGKLWELSADNKRSAVCEAMNVLRDEIVVWLRLKKTFRFWFEKRREARASYAEAAKGNQNRKGGKKPVADADDDDPPPTRDDTIMRTREGRRRMDKLWAEHEARRLERLVIPMMKLN